MKKNLKTIHLESFGSEQTILCIYEFSILKQSYTKYITFFPQFIYSLFWRKIGLFMSRIEALVNAKKNRLHFILRK